MVNQIRDNEEKACEKLANVHEKMALVKNHQTRQKHKTYDA